MTGHAEAEYLTPRAALQPLFYQNSACDAIVPTGRAPSDQTADSQAVILTGQVIFNVKVNIRSYFFLDVPERGG